MRTNTETYEISHGKKPRGFGYWFMQVETTKTSFTHQGTGTMTEVRDGALHRAKQDGRKVTAITVLPQPIIQQRREQ